MRILLADSGKTLFTFCIITMPHWRCPTCNKTFTSTDRFDVHIKGKRNAKCRRFYEKHPASWPNGVYDARRGARIPIPGNEANPTRTHYTSQPAPPGPQGVPPAALEVPNDHPNQPIPPPNDGFLSENDDSMAQMNGDFSDLEDDLPDFGNDGAAPVVILPQTEPNSSAKDEFEEYLARAKKGFVDLPPHMTAAIDLCEILDKAGADLALYDRLIEWHLSNLQATKKITFKALMKKLQDRYNTKQLLPKSVPTTLPACGTKVNVPCIDYVAARIDLLTEPQVKDSDWLFRDGDPRKGPCPDSEWVEIRDINTGLAYRETWKHMVGDKPQTDSGRWIVPDPLIFYMDSCTTGSFMNLSLELVKFTSGLLKRDARNKDYCWRNLGAVPQYVASKTKAKAYIADSGHTDAADYLTDSDKDDISQDSGYTIPSLDDEEYLDDDEKGTMPTIQAQNLHHILRIILAGYKKVQDAGGIEWDFYYKGKLYELQLVPYILFIKGDSVEQDKHCGKYGSKGKGIKSLCRHCLCPAEETDMPYAEHPRKTQPMIAELVQQNDDEALKNMSQSKIWNAWYPLRFGLHNDWGVHGATPLEALHWINLGMFGYTRANLFNQTGKGKLGQAFNNVATHIGWLLQRQSDKEYPRTKFTNGVMKGKLMGHEHTGLILDLAAACRCTGGRKVLLEDSKHMKVQEFFPNKKWVDDWLMMLETQLETEQWLKKDAVSVEEVKRSGPKFREIMSMNKVIGKREEGMGNKTFNFHGTQHMHEEILNFGTAEGLNTVSDEEHHKKDKKSAGKTQKRPKTFEIQSMTQIENRRTIETAVAELKGRVRWHYKERKRELCEKTTLATDGEPELSGVLCNILYDFVLDDWCCNLETLMAKKKKYVYPQPMLVLLQDMAGTVAEWLEPLPVRSELVLPGGQTYRASPHSFGKAWYDWGLFSYKDESTGEKMVLPAHIKAIVDLRRMKMEANRTKYEPTIYLIVETVKTNQAQNELEIASDLFTPYLKCKRRIPGSQSWERTTQIWPLDRLLGPTCVIPDVGNKNPNAFLMVAPMKIWGDILSLWINGEHTKEFEEPQVN